MTCDINAGAKAMPMWMIERRMTSVVACEFDALTGKTSTKRVNLNRHSVLSALLCKRNAVLEKMNAQAVAE
jgi:hypothetical protein